MKKHVSAFEPLPLLTGLGTGLLGAFVCMTIIGKLGMLPNTSIIGALVAITLGRTFAKQFRSLDRQNLVQTSCSGASFAAASAVMQGMAIVFLFDRLDLLFPAILGTSIGTVVGILLLGKIFDSVLFPADASWPPGVATAAAIEAGDEGGYKAKQLLWGVLVGIIGSAFKIPMAGFGIAFIANAMAMLALGVGLVLRGYSPMIFNGFDIGSTYIPHGIIIGGTIAQVVMTARILLSSKNGQKDTNISRAYTVSKATTIKRLLQGLAAFTVGFLPMLFISGAATEMTIQQLFLCIIYTGISSWLMALVCGLCAMNCGWFPNTSVTIVIIMGAMTFGFFVGGFPPLALVMMGGYLTSTGVCFSDMGYDLKTGWLLRKRDGFDLEYELDGRKQQIYAEIMGAIVGVLAATALGVILFRQGLVPPFPKVIKAAIDAGTNASILRTMAIWAIPGAILQFVTGTQNSMGILFGVGLIIKNPYYGIACIVGVILRIFSEKKFGADLTTLRAAGMVTGDGLWSLVLSLFRVFV